MSGETKNEFNPFEGMGERADKMYARQYSLDKLYIMPFWTYHRPLPQEDTLDRVCFNIQYHTENKKRLIQRNGIFW